MNEALRDAIEQWKKLSNKRIWKVTNPDYSIWKIVEDYKNENLLLKELVKFARHDTFCQAYLYKDRDCNCGFSEALNKWLMR
jgi:hypothetical protein